MRVFHVQSVSLNTFKEFERLKQALQLLPAALVKEVPSDTRGNNKDIVSPNHAVMNQNTCLQMSVKKQLYSS